MYHIHIPTAGDTFTPTPKVSTSSVQSSSRDAQTGAHSSRRTMSFSRRVRKRHCCRSLPDSLHVWLRRKERRSFRLFMCRPKVRHRQAVQIGGNRNGFSQCDDGEKVRGGRSLEARCSMLLLAVVHVVASCQRLPLEQRYLTSGPANQRQGSMPF